LIISCSIIPLTKSFLGNAVHAAISENRRTLTSFQKTKARKMVGIVCVRYAEIQKIKVS
jgi:hypothetical protein